MTNRLSPSFLTLFLLLAAHRPASAICPVPLLFGQTEASCGGAYCYVLAPDGSDSIAGDFWSLTFGDPALERGSDNGAYRTEEWCRPFGQRYYLAGGWSQTPGGQDGCINNEIPPGKSKEVMVASFGAEAGGVGYAAVAAVQRDIAAGIEFQFSDLGEDIVLAPIPSPEIVSVSRSAGGLTVRVSQGLPAPAQTDGSTSTEELIRGYLIYGRVVPRRGTPPDSRDRTTWAPLSEVVPFTANADVEDPRCEGNVVLYLATAWAYDSGYESDFVSGNSQGIPCWGRTGPMEPEKFGLIPRSGRAESSSR